MINTLINGLIDLIESGITEPVNTNVLWFDLNTNKLKIYNSNTSQWEEIFMDAIKVSSIPPDNKNVLWYDTNSDKVKYYDNTSNVWLGIYSVVYSNVAPSATDVIWFDTTNEIAKVYNPNNGTWIDIGNGGNSGVVFSDTPPSENNVWFDTTIEKPKIYNPNKTQWGLVKYVIGYTDFDNNNGGNWTNYINIPISSTLTESIQYKIEIVGDNINIYSNGGTTTLVSGPGGNDFWNKIQTDGKDIRVFDETYLQNYFWVEEFDYTNQKCIIWIKLNAGQEKMCIAYGNRDCVISSYCNGDNVFEFFDDFEGTSLNTNKWTIGNGGSYTINNGVVKLSGGYGEVLIANWSLPDSFIVSSKVWTDNSISTNSVCYMIGSYNSKNAYLTRFMPYYPKYPLCSLYYNGDWNNIGYGSYPYTSNTPIILTMIVNTPNMKYLIDDQQLFSTTSFDLTKITTRQFYLSSYTNSYGYIDYIFVRKYADQDISFGTLTIKEFQ